MCLHHSFNSFIIYQVIAQYQDLRMRANLFGTAGHASIELFISKDRCDPGHRRRVKKFYFCTHPTDTLTTMGSDPSLSELATAIGCLQSVLYALPTTPAYFCSSNSLPTFRPSYRAAMKNTAIQEPNIAETTTTNHQNNHHKSIHIRVNLEKISIYWRFI